jgi:hypothetical protein
MTKLMASIADNISARTSQVTVETVALTGNSISEAGRTAASLGFVAQGTGFYRPSFKARTAARATPGLWRLQQASAGGYELVRTAAEDAFIEDPHPGFSATASAQPAPATRRTAQMDSSETPAPPEENTENDDLASMDMSIAPQAMIRASAVKRASRDFALAGAVLADRVASKGKLLVSLAKGGTRPATLRGISSIASLTSLASDRKVTFAKRQIEAGYRARILSRAYNLPFGLAYRLEATLTPLSKDQRKALVASLRGDTKARKASVDSLPAEVLAHACRVWDLHQRGQIGFGAITAQAMGQEDCPECDAAGSMKKAGGKMSCQACGWSKSASRRAQQNPNDVAPWDKPSDVDDMAMNMSQEEQEKQRLTRGSPFFAPQNQDEIDMFEHPEWYDESGQLKDESDPVWGGQFASKMASRRTAQPYGFEDLEEAGANDDRDSNGDHEEPYGDEGIKAKIAQFNQGVSDEDRWENMSQEDQEKERLTRGSPFFAPKNQDEIDMFEHPEWYGPDGQLKDESDPVWGGQFASKMAKRTASARSFQRMKFMARVHRAADDAAEKYWKSYFGKYGETWVSEIKRRVSANIVASFLTINAVDQSAAAYYSAYFGEYGDKMTEEKPRSEKKALKLRRNAQYGGYGDDNGPSWDEERRYQEDSARWEKIQDIIKDHPEWMSSGGLLRDPSSVVFKGGPDPLAQFRRPEDDYEMDADDPPEGFEASKAASKPDSTIPPPPSPGGAEDVDPLSSVMASLLVHERLGRNSFGVRQAQAGGFQLLAGTVGGKVRDKLFATKDEAFTAFRAQLAKAFRL